MVAAAALLAEAPEERRDVVAQEAAAALDEQADQLAHLRREKHKSELKRIVSLSVWI